MLRNVSFGPLSTPVFIRQRFSGFVPSNTIVNHNSIIIILSR